MSQLLENTRYILADGEQILEQLLRDEPLKITDKFKAIKLLEALKEYRNAI